MPTQLTCEDFGLTQEQMLHRLIERMSERMLGLDADMSIDEQEGSYYSKQTIMAKLDEIIKEQVDYQVSKVADQHVIPHVVELMENLVFQETNSWGEKKKPPMTLREYLDYKSSTWLSEKVNWEGKTKADESYSWKSEGSRLMHAVNKHLHDQLEKLIEDAAKDVNAQFADAVKDAVGETISRLKIETKVKRQ